MQPSTDLRALLADPAALCRAQDRHTAALDDWRSSPAAAPVLADFAAYAAGASLSSLPALATLFSDGPAVANFIGALVANMLPALGAAPLGQVPLRHANERGYAAVLIAREGDAALNLVAFDGGALARTPPAQTVAFAPGEAWDAVVAGHGTARLIQRLSLPRGTSLSSDEVRLAPGMALGRDGEREALVVDAAGQGSGPGPHPGLVLLRLQRRAPGLVPTREFDLASGELLHQADATPRESRHTVAIALLGRMGRTDAAPTLAAMALESERGDGVRWNALRECLGLDTAIGFRTLTTIARAPGDPLGHVAGTLRAQLLEQHPVLAEIDPCLA